jgi:hypothetical protein
VAKLTLYYKVLYLLAACKKYEMPSIQLSIRNQVISKQFPQPKGTQAFPAYAIASATELLLEVKCAAISTLEYPMTFEALGKGLRIFEGRALRDLADFRKRCKDNMVACLDSYLDVQPSGPSSIWVGCPEVMPSTSLLEISQQSRVLPIWLNECLSRCRNDLTSEQFTRPLVLDSKIWETYMAAYRTHSHCKFCMKVDAEKGFKYIFGLERKLKQAIDKVLHFWTFQVPRDSPFAGTPRSRLSLLFDLTSSSRKQRDCLNDESIWVLKLPHNPEDLSYHRGSHYKRSDIQLLIHLQVTVQMIFGAATLALAYPA